MAKQQLHFIALRGVMRGRTVFLLNVPAAFAIARMAVEDHELAKPLRVGRLFDESRENAWANALREKSADAPYPPLVVAVDQPVRFRASTGQSKVGTITVASNANWVVQSGRNFLCALRKYAQDEAAFPRDDTITVTLYEECDAERMQSAFRLLQQRGPVSRTRRILGTDSDVTAQIARSLALSDSPFAGLTDMHRSTLAPRAKNLFTLSAIYLATKALLNGAGPTSLDDALPFAREFWWTIDAQLPGWNDVRAGRIASGEMRADFLYAHAVVLHALGRVGAKVFRERPESWKRDLAALSKIDWRRSNSHWEGRALLGGKVANTTANVMLITAFLKSRIGLALTPEEEAREVILKKASRKRWEQSKK